MSTPPSDLIDQVRLWNETTTPYPRDSALHELFHQQARRTPAAPAVEHHGRTLSYGELDRRAARLAERLQAVGVRPGARVGISGGRCVESLVAVLGVLRAGAAYVPLDDGFPEARLRAMAEDAEVQVVVVLPGSVCRLRQLRATVELTADDAPETRAETRTERGAGDAADGPGTAVDATTCAYVVFTSGSAGRPKPVAVPHRGVVRLAVGTSHLTVTPDDRVLHGYSLSSDASTIEIWSALLNGACLVLLDREILVSPLGLGREIGERRISVAFLTTSVLHHTARTHPGAFGGLRHLSAGGEALDPHLARRVLAESRPGQLINFYGPTENSVISTAQVVRDVPPEADSVPIGRPVANSTCYVVRSDGTLAEPGEDGELYVGGDGLALGYCGDDELTARHFVHATFGEAEPRRLYRTGDQARWRADGVLEFRGRRDRQVKLRGYRVELDEVETILRSHPEVGEAVVEAVGDGAELRLAAYVTPAVSGSPPAAERLRAALAEWLPQHVLPHRIQVRAEFPVARNGKVDRRALLAEPVNTPDAAPELTLEPVVQVPAARRPEQTAARPDTAGGALQQSLGQVWETLLRVPVSPQDSFFDLGGDSLLASEMVTRSLNLLGMEAAHGSALVRHLLDDPTLTGFASTAHALRRGAATGAAPERVDFDREADLGAALPEASGPAPRVPQREILLTGASGFVGAFLLDRLLRRTDARVLCPVRARDARHARRRVLNNLARYHIEADWPQERLVCFPSDLTAPQLGLDEKHFTELSETVDLVLHAGALVNFLYPYTALRQANVEGTREVIALAAPRRVPVHFVSTIAVIAGFGSAGVRYVPEDVPLRHGDRLTMGYAESKWVAEGLLREAADQGLPVTVHRPYEVTGERRSGICNTATAISSLFRTIAETGLAPDIDLPLDFVPVDYLADAVTHILTTRPAESRVYHLTNPRPATLADMIGRMRAAGHHIIDLPYKDWVGELVRHVAAHPNSPTAPFISLCVDHGNKSDLSIKELFFNDVFPAFGQENVERGLAGSGLDCPPVDAALLDLYLEYFYRTEYLRRPDRAPALEHGAS
ncbi:amino acid adenylation domain-containing protein [Streptomyces sp. AJS327]|uniref:amino acid adenylation domain-containing protein n=1 Tax=Streptomyces sp. AJS327 TaxID=2545265 RepID=UPI0015DEDD95|nr:amino acid adenylation domain-containing protein [Streptomyces sp. AJS327]MBA0050996.1 amino acid adenylation domain-containing protein [Streptomyces sp. AJS327]